MGWRIIHVTDVNHIALNLNSLKITKGDLEVKVPLGDIFALIIEDLTVTVSTRLLVELSDYNILVILCNQKHLPECVIQPIAGHFNQYKQIKEQIDWNDDFKKILWQQIIKQKIMNQIGCLKFIQIDIKRIEKMKELQSLVQVGDTQNIEGQAAKYYFNSLFKSFNRDDDELLENAVLNYGYTILNAAVARTIVAKGLLPAIGIHHIGSRNHFNLASDTVEPFRPLVDLFLVKHPPVDFLTKDYRVKLINLMHARILIDNKMETVIRAIEITIQSIIDYFKTGDIEKIKLPSIKRYEYYEL
ncbi:type II CRISPR-associated endonuclease Cas1 [Staphylococcus auricularis]|uniref:type II CRISPR-associated endonuclease Cas1 n=1 Tax=Staphylococcus auricularis TaxID=29379 RepID=UPI0012469A34|nr:type II CRISPR-associated endonuclease Cas1 [Staphylococcus auricularis]